MTFYIITLVIEKKTLNYSVHRDCGHSLSYLTTKTINSHNCQMQLQKTSWIIWQYDSRIYHCDTFSTLIILSKVKI